MSEYLKLIKTGRRLVIYDGVGNYRNMKNCQQEKQEDLYGGLTVERLIMNNFKELEATYFVYYSQYGNLEDAKRETRQRLNKFLRKRKDVTKYLAVIEPLPKGKEMSKIHVLIDSPELYLNSRKELRDIIGRIEDEGTVCSEYDIASQFKAIVNNNGALYDNKKVYLMKNLESPIILFNYEAEAYIKEKQLYKYSIVDVKEFYDKVGGWMRYTEYDLAS
jgi:hypothetical protein